MVPNATTALNHCVNNVSTKPYFLLGRALDHPKRYTMVDVSLETLVARVLRRLVANGADLHTSCKFAARPYGAVNCLGIFASCTPRVVANGARLYVHVSDNHGDVETHRRDSVVQLLGLEKRLQWGKWEGGILQREVTLVDTRTRL